MATHRIRKLIMLPLFLASLSSCQITPEDNSAQISVKADKYDSPDLTAASLEEDGCMVFEDMYFARGEEKDHAFRVKNDKITEHVTCPKAKFDESNFDDVIGEPFFKVIQKIGIPSFRGLEKDHSVSYLCKDGIERALSLSLNTESEWTVAMVSESEKDFRFYLSDYIDETTTYKPSLERCKKIKMGMYINDVFAILGRPCRFVDSGASTVCWGISSGGSFHVSKWNEYEGCPFFDPSIFERDDYFPTTKIEKNKKTVEVPCYWGVVRLNFNEHKPEDFDDHSVSFV